MSASTPLPLAVIGTACRLPGEVTDFESLWRLLIEGRNAWSPVPSERFNEAAFYHPDPECKGTTNHRGGHFISQHPGAFDSAFFGISANEARAIDPQQRLALEATYEAFENGGIPLEDVRGSSTAVFAACFTHDYDRNLQKDTNSVPKYQTTGTGEAILANRISYIFDLRGPSMTIDTGCSGSLVALHQACSSLRNGESDMAIATGVNMILGPDTMNGMSNLHMLSDDGRSYSFDARGAGYGRGEGVAALLIKRLDDAIASGDHIQAIIRNTGVNQDGKTNGITLPNRHAQEALARRVYSQAGLNPKETQYVEAHGTGTAAGDALELQGLANVFGYERQQNLWVGSIKSNIGHTESTSGLAGVCKAILALQKGFIPPNADFRSPKPELKLEEWNIRIATTPEPWPDVKVRRASVNSFGYGGTNAHVILEAPSSSSLSLTRAQFPIRSSAFLLTLSAKSERSLSSYSQSLADWTGVQSSSEVVPSLLHTLNNRRSKHTWRRTVVADSLEGISRSLVFPAQPSKHRTDLSLSFVFTGQGAQWPTMGRELISTSSKFAESIKLSSEILRDLGCSWDLLEELQRESPLSRIHESALAQPASTALQIALVDILRDLQICPDMVIGHSSGEVAAAYCAGVLSHKTALTVSYHRSQISCMVKEIVSSKGAMLAVGLGEAEVSPLLENLKAGKVVVACVNSPSSTTLSGDQAGIDEISDFLTSQNIFNRALKVDTAYHSHHMQVVARIYLESMGELETSTPSLHFQSTVEAGKKTQGFEAQYWVDNLVSKVRFCDALELFYKDQLKSATKGRVAERLFVEIGPHSALAGPVRQILKDVDPDLKHTYLSALTRNRNADVTLLELAGKLWEYGFDPDLNKVNSIGGREQSSAVLTSLPSYNWDHSSIYWHESRLSRNHLHRRYPPHDLLGVRIPSSTDLEPVWTHFIDLKTLPWLEEHIIDNLVIFPGAGYICMALEALRQLHADMQTANPILRYEFKNVNFLKALVVPQAPQRIEMQLRLSNCSINGQAYQEFSVSALSSNGVWFEHCRGFGMAQRSSVEQNVDEPWYNDVLKKTADTYSRRMSATEVYKQLLDQGNKYGPNFALLRELKLDGRVSVGTARIPDIQSVMPARYQQPHILHPSTLDGLMHAVLPLYMQANGESSIMPASIGRMTLSPLLPNEAGTDLIVAAKISPTGIRSADADVSVFDATTAACDRQPLLRLEDIDVRGVGQPAEQASADSLPDIGYQMEWAQDVDLIHLSGSTTADTLFPAIDLHLSLPLIDSGYNSDISSRASDAGSAHSPKPDNIKLSEYLKLLSFKQPYLSVLIAGEDGLADFWQSLASKSLTIYRCDTVGISEEQHQLCKQSFGSSCGSALSDFDNEQDSSYDLIVVTPNVSQNIMNKLLTMGGRVLTMIQDPKSGPLSENIVSKTPSSLHKKTLQLSTEVLGQDCLLSLPSEDELSRVEASVDIIATSSMNTIGTRLALAFEHYGIPSNTKTLGVPLDRNPNIRIILDDGSQPILSQPSADEFQAIKTILAQSEVVIWLSVQDDPAHSKNAAKGLVRGFARTACAEYDGLRFITLDVQDRVSSSLDILSQTLASILAQCISKAAWEKFEIEYILRDRKVLIPRAIPDLSLNSRIAHWNGQSISSKAPYGLRGQPLRAEFEIGKPTKKISFVQSDRFQDNIDDDQLEVHVASHGLTKHDASIFLEPVPFDTAPIVAQCAGTITAVGKETSGFSCGDRVIVVGGEPLASDVRVGPEQVYRMPKNISFESAATIAAPSMVAYRTLVQLAGLDEGDSVLVNNGASALGRAAVSIAKHLKAKVLAVVSNDMESSLLLLDLGLEPSEIFVDPTSHELKTAVMKRTEGHGVDAVFNNANSSDPLDLLRLVSPAGSYIKSSDNDTINSLRSVSTVNHITFNLHTYARTKPAKLLPLLRSALDAYYDQVSSHAEPLLFSMDQTLEALQAVKKTDEPVALKVGTEDKVNFKTSEATAPQLQSDATYVIAGGSGDIGQRVCNLLVSRGARTIVLLSRRKLSEEKKNELESELRLAHPRVRIDSIACDVSNTSAVEAAAQRIRGHLPAVRGLFQCAAVLYDCPLETMDADRFNAALSTKYAGTKNLYAAFDSSDLDFFIMMSSVSGVVGTRGQANYAAGNAYKDALAQNATGSTRVMALDLGLAAGSSVYDGNDVRVTNLLRQGLVPCDQLAISAFIDYAISDEAEDCRQAIIGFNPSSLQHAVNATPIMKSAIFNHVRLPSTSNGAAEADTSKSLKEALGDCTTNTEAVTLIQNSLVGVLSNLVSVEEENISVDTPMADFGLDSLTAIELKNWIAKEANANVQSSEILDEANIHALAERIASRSSIRAGQADDEAADKSHSTVSVHTEPANTKLPQLPLPNIETTLNTYIDSVSSFLTPRELESTARLVAEFQAGPAFELQERLKRRVNDPELDAWAYDLHAKNVYLKDRSPLYPGSTFYGAYQHSGKQSQAHVAAQISFTALDFKARLEGKTIERDTMNGEPMCTESLNWLFNAIRLPQLGEDVMQKHDSSSHIAVLSRGHIFKITVPVQTRQVSLSELTRAFESISEQSSSEKTSLAALTASERDTWAITRNSLIQASSMNSDLFQMVESAAFVVCLDNESPSNADERCNQYMQGPVGNRWSDKPLQFIVCSNGRAGYVMEHAGLDGASSKQITAAIESTLSGESDTAMNSGSSLPIKEFVPELDTATQADIIAVSLRASKSSTPAQFKRLEISTLSGQMLREKRIAAKTGANICIQLASRMNFGMQHPGWETVSMATFHKGRIDWMQSVQPTVFKFLEAASTENVTSVKDETSLKALLREAATAHSTNLTHHARGRGFMEHMILLQAMVQEGESMPTIFEDDVWKDTHPLSSRKLKTDTSEGIGETEAGFHMPDPESVFVHYEVYDDKITFAVQATANRAQVFCDHIEHAAKALRDILE